MAIRDHYPHGQFCWVDLVSRDMSEAREFYRRLFGWQSVDIDTQGGPPYAHFDLEGKSVAGLGQMNQEMLDRRLPAMWNSYIHVDDIEAACAQVTQLGGLITVPVMKVLDAGSLAFIRDPTGAQVGLWQKDRHFGAELHQDYHCFCWNELCTRDVDQAADFYGRLLGWEFSEYPSQSGQVLRRPQSWRGVQRHVADRPPLGRNAAVLDGLFRRAECRYHGRSGAATRRPRPGPSV